MKGFNLKRSLLIILALYPSFLVANIKMELAAKIKATTDKTQGIFTMVDTILMKRWKAAGMKFRFYRSITGANDFKRLHENWRTYQLFDVEATPGIWYEYKVEVLEKGAKKPYFLTPLEPVKGFRPPSTSIAAQFHWAKPFKYKGHIYLDWNFSDENGNLILPDSATYHVKYDTEAEQDWIYSMGTPSKVKIHKELETSQSRLIIKILPGMKTILFCGRVAQKGGISRFHCMEIVPSTLEEKKPGLAGLTPRKPKYHQLDSLLSGQLAMGTLQSRRYNTYQVEKESRGLNPRMGQARVPRKQRLVSNVG